MSVRLHFEMNQLKKSILTLGAAVEEALYLAVKALQERDEKTALKVIETDQEIDNMEVELEEECLKLLALHQPVATDLRQILTTLKISNDVERVGDHAVNIAKAAGRKLKNISPACGKHSTGCIRFTMPGSAGRP